MHCKTDSYVVETETHFPTDYGLLFDSARKCLEILGRLASEGKAVGWRKAKLWCGQLKGLMRKVGRVSGGGGKDKGERLKGAVVVYLEKARRLAAKVNAALDAEVSEGAVFDRLVEVEYYYGMLLKHIDLLERRVVKGEHIPHSEKVFSIFMPFTEWVKKGKKRPNVEIGKKLFVTTDQYHLIVDHRIGENQADNQLTLQIADRLIARYTVQSLSTDKGFSDKEDRELLCMFIPEVVMPKKGKRTEQETETERAPAFKKRKNAHSAIESNINALEHRGLDRCPDRSGEAFRNYVAMGITAYNLHRIGQKLLADRRKAERKAAEKLRKAEKANAARQRPAQAA